MEGGREERVDLGRERTLGELLSLTFALFARHFSLAFTLALIVVAPYVLIVDGIWGRALADGADANVRSATRASVVIAVLVVQPLITAMLVRVVLEVADGRVPSLGAALRAGLALFPAAAVAVALASIGIVVGIFLLVIPGIWLAVRWYFAAQVVVVEGHRAGAALTRSAEIVRGQWWTTAGRIVVIGLLAALLGSLVGGILGGIGSSAGSPALYVVGLILGQSATSALGALGATLLFFDRRAGSRPAVADAG